MFEGKPNEGGDCSHIKTEDPGFILIANNLYYGNSQFLHESIPLDKPVHRTMVRITLPMDYPLI